LSCGGAGRDARHTEDEDYDVFIVTMASKYPFPTETDCPVVTDHEYVHVVQFAHIASEDRDEHRELMVENPWWSEGQPGVDANDLKDPMSWKMETQSMLESDERFSDIPYGERGRIGYDLGAWFIAYLNDCLILPFYWPITCVQIQVRSQVIHPYDMVPKLCDSPRWARTTRN
jgi:hypothetical protein